MAAGARVARWGGCVLLALGCGLAQAQPQPPSAAEVLACMRANVPQTLQIKDVELRARAADGAERSLRGRLHLRRDGERLRAMLRIVAPADLAGTAYLLREQSPADEMYMYLPSLGKVRRLRGTAAQARLWGSDLSYGDLKILSNSVGSAGVRVEGSEAVDGRPAYRLAVMPADSAGVTFELMRVWVDADSCLALRAELLRGGAVHKRLSVDPAQLRHDGRYWYAAALRIDDLQQRSTTQLRILSVTLDGAVSERYFSPATFHLGN